MALAAALISIVGKSVLYDHPKLHSMLYDISSISVPLAVLPSLYTLANVD
jgi:hypothetical protein